MGQPATAFNLFADEPRELVIGDPHAQPGLIPHISDTVAPTRVINFYHFHLWPKQKTYCAKCGAHRHRDGFTIELDDGTWALAGSKCAADLWGDRWKTIRKSFDKELHAAGIILDVRPILTELEGIRAAIENSWRPIVERMAAYQRRFRGMTGPLYDALKRAAEQPDHHIVVDNKPSQYLEGWAFFTTDIKKHFTLALDELDVAIDSGYGRQTKLGAYTVKLGEAREHLDLVAHAVRAFRSFFAPQEAMHFVNAIEDASRSLGVSFVGRYKIDGAHIVDHFTNQSMRMPDNYPLLNTVLLRRLNEFGA